jgi:hypothetical protein
MEANILHLSSTSWYETFLSSRKESDSMICRYCNCELSDRAENLPNYYSGVIIVEIDNLWSIVCSEVTFNSREELISWIDSNFGRD